MIELSLLSLLNTMAPKFCEYKAEDMDTTMAVLLAFSDLHTKYDPIDIQTTIRESRGFKETAVLVAATTCPLDAIK
jgi:hypothetical protein